MTKQIVTITPESASYDDERNVNEVVAFRLTDEGREVVKAHYDSMITETTIEEVRLAASAVKEQMLGDEEGVTRVPLWEMMSILGPAMGSGTPALVESNSINFRNSNS